MTELLIITGTDQRDEELLEQIGSAKASRVTVLIEAGERNWAQEDSPSARALRDRLAALLARIEQRTGAVVVGLAGDAEQLRGWRFDRVIDARIALAA
jgi:hypothetical protein